MTSTLISVVLVINELMAANLGTVMSPATNFDSWIELYNPTDEPVELSGLWLSDDPGNPQRWQLPAGMGSVPAKGYKVVWLGSNNIKSDQAPFKLNCDGGTVLLTDAGGNEVCRADYPKAMSRTAWARTEDGGTQWGWTATPTPAASNATAQFASERLEAPVIDTDSKLFTGSINVKVEIPEGCVLMYTTNGTVPTTASSDSDAPGTWKEWIVNGDCEGDDATCLVGKNGEDGGKFSTRFVNGAGYNGSRGMVIHAVKNPTNAWDTQLFVYTPKHTLHAGDKYRFRMKVRADKNAYISVQSHTTPSNYIHWQMLAGGYNVTTQWQEIDYEGTVTDQQAGSSGLQTIAFNLNELGEENNYYFDDISWESAVSGGDANASYRSLDGQFTFTKTTNLCCRLFRDGWLPSVPVTRSYIQTTNNYTIPVISIVGDPRYFTDPTWGIDVQGTNGIPGNGRTDPCNWNQDWDRPVNFSYITPEGEMAFNQDVNICVSGGWTRAASPRSFKLKSGKAFDGQNHLDYPFFPQKPYIRSQVLLVRNGGNDTWENNSSRFMDPALQTIVQRSGIDMDLQSYLPVIEYVNGQFRGVLNLREPNNKRFVNANHGYDDDEIDMFENFQFAEGSDSVLNRIFELGKNINKSGAYDEMKTLLDIDEFTNYMAAELFLGSSDWPHNNVKAYRSQADGRYRFVFFDLDFAFKYDNPFQEFYKHQYDSSYSDFPYRNFCVFFINLLNNADFRKKFTDTFCLMAGSVFEKSRVKAIVNELADHVRPMMQLDGWKSPDPSADKIKSQMETRWTTMTNYMQRFSPMKLSGVRRHRVQLSADTEGATLLVNDIEVPYASLNGYLFAPIRLEAKAPMGYQFAGWKKGNTAKTYFSTDSQIDLPSDSILLLKACFTPLTAEEKKELDVHPVRINEVSAANNIYVNEYWQRNDWVELFNPTDELQDVAGMWLSDNAEKPEKWQISSEGSEASTMIAPHGHLIIWCDKLAPQTQLHAPFRLSADGGDVVLTAHDGSWTDRLRYETHQSDETVGRYPDGSNDVYVLNVPTIDYQNIGSSYMKSVEQPTIVTDVNLMAMDSSFVLRLTANGLTVCGTADSTVDLRIVNLAGITIMETKGKLTGGTMTFDTGQLERGIYVAFAKDAQGREVSIKFKV